MARSLTAKEVHEIIEKMWANTDDIKRLGCVGNNKALKIKKELRNYMVDHGYVVPRNLVDMQLVIEYFNIDVSRIERLMGGVVNG